MCVFSIESSKCCNHFQPLLTMSVENLQSTCQMTYLGVFDSFSWQQSDGNFPNLGNLIVSYLFVTYLHSVKDCDIENVIHAKHGRQLVT